MAPNTRYRFKLNVYDGDTLIGQQVAHMPVEPDDGRQGFTFTHSQLHVEGESTVMLVANIAVERRVVD